MKKLIIDNRTKNLSDEQCLTYVSMVIRKGKISKTRDIEHYCFATTFFPNNDQETSVYFKLNRSSGTFIVTQNTTGV